jgi:putative DNA primase/helicase
MPTALEAASGRWPELLVSLAHLSADQLTDTHQPCPACGGEDRYRWDQDDADGGWYCNQCGGKNHQGGGGSGMDLLTRVTGWDFKQACRHIERHLGITTDSTPRTEPPTAGAEHVWRYTDDFVVCRFPGKKIRPLTWTGTDWAWKSPAKPRPLYWARKLAGAPVLIAEGEKAADAAAQLFPDHAVCTWPGGTSNVKHAGWQPLVGRNVTIWPDADDVGRKAAAQLASILLPIAASVHVVNPPGDLEQGWDLADALAEGWKPSKAAKALSFAKPVELPPAEPEPAPAEPAPTPPAREIPKTASFVCLGFDQGVYYYQPSSTGQVTPLARGSHTGTNLIQLAPIGYWETCHPSKNGVDWLSAASALFERQAAVGIFSPDRIRGRGAWWDAGRSVLHLGDRLLVDGEPCPISQLPSSKFHYQRLGSIDLPEQLDPLTDNEGAELLDLADRFHWEVPASGLLLAGWIALAPICGALQWRPHVWLTASAGSGKSAILDRFIGTLIESLALFPEGNTTEAFIRQELRADAIPVVFDEAESNEKADRQRIQNILSLARVSSSSGRGVIGKGSSDGTAQRFTIRSMFLLCSISTALKQGADQSRFAQLTLRNPSFLPKPERAAHWSALDADITRLCTTELGHRLLLRMVRQIPIIRDSVAVFRRAAADRFDSQRQGDQYGTLLAGAWSLMNSRPATIEDAYQLIDSNKWEAYKDQVEVDERRCIQSILQHQVRVESEERICTRTLGELVEIAAKHRFDNEVTTRQALDALSRHGLKVDDDARLIVSNTAQAISTILRDTPWASGWSTVLSRLPGAQRTAAVRFSGAGAVSRAISIEIGNL